MQSSNCYIKLLKGVCWGGGSLLSGGGVCCLVGGGVVCDTITMTGSLLDQMMQFLNLYCRGRADLSRLDD